MIKLPKTVVRVWVRTIARLSDEIPNCIRAEVQQSRARVTVGPVEAIRAAGAAVVCASTVRVVISVGGTRLLSCIKDGVDVGLPVVHTHNNHG